MHNENPVGKAEPQAPNHKTVESVDSGTKPFNPEAVREMCETEPRSKAKSITIG